MILLPYSTEVHIRRWPIGNLAIIGICVFVSLLIPADSELFAGMVLWHWHPIGMITYMFLHSGIMHLVLNMLALWVFGNTVCEKIGSLLFALVFILTGFIAGVVHMTMDVSPAIGASGAINGVIGFYLVLHPVNRINCLYWVLVKGGTFAISGFWIVLLWFGFDAYGALSHSQSGIAYWAHLGGFISGVMLGVLFLRRGWAKMESYDNPTLLDYIFKDKPQRKTREERADHGFGRLGRSAAPLVKTEPMRTPVPPTKPPPPSERAATPEKSEAHQQPEQFTNIDCPHCAQNLDMPTDMIGISFACPACAKQILVEQEGT